MGLTPLPLIMKTPTALEDAISNLLQDTQMEVLVIKGGVVISRITREFLENGESQQIPWGLRYCKGPRSRLEGVSVWGLCFVGCCM